MLRRRFVRDLVGQLGCDRTFICRKNTCSHGALPNYQRKKAKMRFDQDVRLRDLFGISIPIIQAPMAGAAFSDMVVAVSEAGGLGSLACAMLTSLQIRQEVGLIRQQTSRPINLNFFCHRPPVSDARRDASWKRRLEPYYRELAIDPLQAGPSASRGAFDAVACEIVEEIIPEVVSFHFGLPEETLVERVKSIGCRIISSATTVSEARWLEERGCDAIVAPGIRSRWSSGNLFRDGNCHSDRHNGPGATNRRRGKGSCHCRWGHRGRARHRGGLDLGRFRCATGNGLLVLSRSKNFSCSS